MTVAPGGFCLPSVAIAALVLQSLLRGDGLDGLPDGAKVTFDIVPPICARGIFSRTNGPRSN
jgi:hypothetical protein